MPFSVANSSSVLSSRAAWKRNATSSSQLWLLPYAFLRTALMTDLVFFSSLTGAVFSFFVIFSLLLSCCVDPRSVTQRAIRVNTLQTQGGVARDTWLVARGLHLAHARVPFFLGRSQTATVASTRTTGSARRVRDVFRLPRLAEARPEADPRQYRSLAPVPIVAREQHPRTRCKKDKKHNRGASLPRFGPRVRLD